MEKLEKNYQGIRELLNKVQCPYRLYEARIKALEFIVNKDFILMIQKNIKSKIAHFVEIGWVKQFERDLDVFGLYEAILYFHTYPYSSEARDFIKEACELYHLIASTYMDNHSDLISSDDPRIQAQLETIRFKGAHLQHVPSLQMSPLAKPDVIEQPLEPTRDPQYTRQLPMHEDYKALVKSFGDSTTKGPVHIADELIEHLASQYMFEDFPGIQIVFFEIANILQRFKVDPFSSTGQFVLLTIIEHMNEDYYGDFDRWIDCIKCGKSFMPEISLSTANLNLIQGGWVCERCCGSEN